MNSLLLWLLLSLSLTDISGTWRETSRKAPGGRDIPFTDTTFYEFKVGNQWLRGRPNGYQYRGVYKIENNKLDLGLQRYDIVSMDDQKLVLEDVGGRYTFEKYSLSNAGIKDGMDASGSSERAQAPQELKTLASLKDVTGKWQPFKRTSAKTLEKVDYTRLIKTFVVYEKPRDGKLGEIYGGMDPGTVPSWYIESYQKGILSAARKDGTDRRNIRIVSYKDGELIFQEGPLTYFLKQF